MIGKEFNFDDIELGLFVNDVLIKRNHDFSYKVTFDNNTKLLVLTVVLQRDHHLTSITEILDMCMY